MGYPPQPPYGPDGHPQPWQGQQQPPPGYVQPPHGYVQQPPPGYVQQPVPMPVYSQHVRSVSKQRGLGAMSHTVHLVLTICTCGVWGLCVWLPWWIFRMIVRRKTTTHHYYR
ncbi:hypothetical protein [Nonomuraea dietziae]|uniref:hypothetical protein n=1 Tax=Nonomuraea dietziae TaxID=65515 RepID=UPI00343BFDB3